MTRRDDFRDSPVRPTTLKHRQRSSTSTLRSASSNARHANDIRSRRLEKALLCPSFVGRACGRRPVRELERVK